jgi:error-prone DNA polymerase
MGFYAPAQLVRDAQEHGVTVLPPDVNYSDWNSTLEPIGTGGFALRLGMRQIGGLREDAAQRIVIARDAPYRDLKDIQTRARVTAPILRRLAEADAMRSMFLDRRQALWDAKGLRDAPDLPLFQDRSDEGVEPVVPLPVMPVCEQVVADYQTLRLSLKKHPMAFLRKSMAAQGFMDTGQLLHARNFQKLKMAGLVLIRQKPGTAKGVCFITIEDEFGVANLVVWPKVMDQFRKVVMQSRLLAIEGHVQRDVEIIHVIATHLSDRTDALMRLAPEGLRPALSPADEVARPIPSPRGSHPRDVRIIPKSRDFH